MYQYLQTYFLKLFYNKNITGTFAKNGSKFWNSLYTVPKEMKDSEIKHEMYLGLIPIWRRLGM
jgi:hypothetical protein